jgi:hypothetical protein
MPRARRQNGTLRASWSSRIRRHGCAGLRRSRALNPLGALLNGSLLGRAGRHPDVPRHPAVQPRSLSEAINSNPGCVPCLGFLFMATVCLNLPTNKIAQSCGSSKGRGCFGPDNGHEGRRLERSSRPCSYPQSIVLEQPPGLDLKSLGAEVVPDWRIVDGTDRGYFLSTRLRARCQRPRNGSAAERGYELSSCNAECHGSHPSGVASAAIWRRISRSNPQV